jgi:hypothetical protein
MLDVIIANKVAILGFLWCLSEALSFIPSVEANGVFQLIKNALKKVMGR